MPPEGVELNVTLVLSPLQIVCGDAEPVGLGLTVKEAEAELVQPLVLVTTTVYVPASPEVAAAITYELLIAVGITTLFRYH